VVLAVLVGATSSCYITAATAAFPSVTPVQEHKPMALC